jgi:hypothetical protein
MVAVLPAMLRGKHTDVYHVALLLLFMLLVLLGSAAAALAYRTGHCRIAKQQSGMKALLLSAVSSIIRSF